MTSGSGPIVRNVGSGAAAAIASVRSRISASGSGGGGAAGAGCSNPASIESMSSWLIAAGSAAGGGGGAAAFGAGAAAAGLGGSGFAGFAVSSSAMMRRMEARISSIEGSWAFAGWFMAASLSLPAQAAPSRQPTCESRPPGRPQSDSDYRNSKAERKQQPVDRSSESYQTLMSVNAGAPWSDR